MNDLSDSRVPEEAERAAQAAQGQGPDSARKAFDKLTQRPAESVRWDRTIERDMQNKERYAKLSGALQEAVAAMQQHVAGISERESVKCILQAIMVGDFSQYIVQGSLLGEFHYHPYAKGQIMQNTIEYQAKRIQELEAQLQFYMKPVTGDGH